MGPVKKVEYVRKRDGRIVPYDESRIANAIFKAAQAVGGEDRKMAEELSSVVTLFVEKEYGNGRIPGIEWPLRRLRCSRTRAATRGPSNTPKRSWTTS